MAAKNGEEILILSQKHFISIYLGKIKFACWQDNFDDYIKTVSYFCFYFSICIISSLA